MQTELMDFELSPAIMTRKEHFLLFFFYLLYTVVKIQPSPYDKTWILQHQSIMFRQHPYWEIYLGRYLKGRTFKLLFKTIKVNGFKVKFWKGEKQEINLPYWFSLSWIYCSLSYNFPIDFELLHWQSKEGISFLLDC